MKSRRLGCLQLVIAIGSIWSGTASATVLAQDSFGSYAAGPGALFGQTVGGAGFSGTWHAVGSTPPLTGNLDVLADGSVGSIGTVFASSAGNAANFSAPIGLGGGELFIRYTHVNLDTTDPQGSTRLDLNLGSETTGNRVFLGAYNDDTLKIFLEQNLYSGATPVSADSGSPPSAAQAATTL